MIAAMRKRTDVPLTRPVAVQVTAVLVAAEVHPGCEAKHLRCLQRVPLPLGVGCGATEKQCADLASVDQLLLRQQLCGARARARANARENGKSAFGGAAG